MRTSILALCLSVLGAAPALAGAPAEKEVLAAMDAWKQAMIKKDRAVLDKLLHPDLTYGHSSGVVENKAQAIEHVMSTKVEYVGINFSDTKVRLQGRTALVTGKADLQERTDGKDRTVNLVVLSVWVKGAPGWQMIGRQATKPTPPTPAAASTAPTPPTPAAAVR